MDLSQKKELVVKHYEDLFDKDQSYKAVRATAEEIQLFEHDTELQERLEFIIIEKRKSLIRSLSEIMTGAEKESDRLRAALELGKIIYPSKFVEGYNEKTKKKEIDINLRHKMIKPLTKDDAANTLRILSECGGLDAILAVAHDSTDDEIHSADTDS